MEEKELAEILGGSELFAGVPSSKLKDIACLCRIERRNAGDFVFRQGELGSDLYVILDGLVVLKRSIELSGKHGSASIAKLGRGRALGCWSTLLDGARILMSSALCEKPTTLAVFSGEQLRECINKDKELGLQVLKSLCFLLRDRVVGAYGAMERL